VISTASGLELFLFYSYQVLIREQEIYLSCSLDILCQYNIPQTVPEKGEISFEDLSEKSGLKLDLLARFLRLAICNYIFAEPKSGYVAHTARSLIMARGENAGVGPSFVSCAAVLQF